MDITNDTLNETIEDSVNDALSPDDTPNEGLDVSSDTPTDTDTDPDLPPDPVTGTEPVKDEFETRFGVQGQSFTGKENRIPYSRVKKIVAKAEAEARKVAEEALRKQLEGEYNPKVTDYETKIKNYEDVLQRVAAYEQMLENDPQTFLTNLAKHPAYKPFFDQFQQPQNPQSAQPTIVRDPVTGRFMTAQQQQKVDSDPMPMPDKTYPDGTPGYTEEGLSNLLEWKARNVESRIMQRIEQRYAPIEQDWQAQRRAQEMIPQIEKQIAEARTWDRFSELESEIVNTLQQNPNMSLDRAYMLAYQKNVIPKLAADKNTMRQEVLAELKKQPVQTAAPVRNMRSAPPRNGPRDLSDIIREEVEKVERQ